MAADLDVSSPSVFAAFSIALGVSALVGPSVGATIDKQGGRSVLVSTSLLFAIGLGGLGVSQGFYSMLASWLVLGLAMGAGLYDAAFSVLVRLYGKEARSSIAGVTLIAGFASTVGWPITALLEAQVDWRFACFAWATVHLVVALPLNRWLPDQPVADSRSPQDPTVPPSPTLQVNPAQSSTRAARRATLALGFVFAATSFISTAMASHLPGLLAATGATAPAAVLAASLIGPAQVAARLLEFSVLRRIDPVRSARFALALHPVGAITLLAAGTLALPVFAFLHGAGNGWMTIAKGLLPLSIFGHQGYGRRQGILVAPARLSQALAPWLFGLVLARWGQWAFVLTICLGTIAAAALWLIPRVEARVLKPSLDSKSTSH
jgi:predicted MFS family arabinose efflux permease